MFCLNLNTNEISSYYFLELIKNNDKLLELCILEFLKNGKIESYIHDFRFVYKNIFMFYVMDNDDLFIKIKNILENHKYFVK